LRSQYGTCGATSTGAGEETKRIANVLHMRPANCLVAVVYRTDKAYPTRFAGRSTACSQGDAAARSDRSQLRRLSHELGLPALLKDLGLVPACWYLFGDSRSVPSADKHRRRGREARVPKRRGRRPLVPNAKKRCTHVVKHGEGDTVGIGFTDRDSIRCAYATMAEDLTPRSIACGKAEQGFA